MTITPAFYTPDELAERWRTTEQTIRERCRAGDIPHFRIPGSRLYRISAEDVRRIEGCTSLSSGDCVARKPLSLNKTTVLFESWNGAFRRGFRPAQVH